MAKRHGLDLWHDDHLGIQWHAARQHIGRRLHNFGITQHVENRDFYSWRHLKERQFSFHMLPMHTVYMRPS